MRSDEFPTEHAHTEVDEAESPLTDSVHEGHPGETASPPASTPDTAAAAEPPGVTSLSAGTPGTPVSAHTPLRPASAPAGRRRRWPLWAAAAALLLGAIGAGGYAYADHYENLAIPGTSVAGIDVAGMSREEVVAAVTAAADDVTVTISGDATATASLADLGTAVDAEATADAVMARGDSVADRFKALFADNTVPVVVDTQAATIQAYAVDLVPDDRVKAVDAAVVLNAEGTGFEITPSSDGTSVDASALEQAAAAAATSLSSKSIEVSFVSAPPEVSDAEAQAVADEANAWVAQDVTITAADGESTFTAEDTVKASWVTITTGISGPPSIALDPAKITAWVGEQAEEVTVEPVTGVRNVNTRGDVVATSVEAVAGESVSNTDALVQAIISTVSTDQPYAGTFEMTTAEEKWEQRTIADGAENLAYPAAPGEKWVDINLSNKTVTAYEGATVVRGPVSMVDGAPATPTVTGTFKVYLQYQSQTMRGQNADGTDYVAEDVPWVSYFHQGYALHGAPWRSSFGFSGSHGCVNMPVGEAQWFYTWVSIGTTVSSHY